MHGTFLVQWQVENIRVSGVANFVQENLFKEYYLESIKNEGKLYSATEDGKMGFIAVEDIAGVALALLTSDEPLNGGNPLVIGPEILSHDEVSCSNLLLFHDQQLTLFARSQLCFQKVLVVQLSM